MADAVRTVASVPATARFGAPNVGEHAAKILADHDFGHEPIDALARPGPITAVPD